MDIQQALVETLEETLVTSTGSNGEEFAVFLELIQTMRKSIMVPRMPIADIKKHIWDTIRSNGDLLTTVITMTATFQLALGSDNIIPAIEDSAKSLEIFEENTIIKDDDGMDKSFPSTYELTLLFRNDRWLWLMTLLSLNIRLIDGVLKPKLFPVTADPKSSV